MALTENLTLQDWPIIARAAGVDPAPYVLARKWIKEERGRAQVTLSMMAPGLPGLIVKQVFLPDDPAHIAACIAAQRQAATALSGHAKARVPPVLAVDEARRLILMPLVPGETVFALCDDPRDHAGLLERAGAWTAAFHGARATEQRRFQPRFMADHLAKLAAEVASGTRRVADPPRFQAIVAAVRASAGAAQDAPTVSAVRHGDLQARNLIIDGDVTWGIDLSPVQAAPVGYDIARFLLDHMASVADLRDQKRGQVVTDAVRTAFFRGYDLTGPDDAAVGFLCLVRFALDWASLPPDLSKASVRRLVQYERMRQIAAVGLGVG
jgi:hypothetical protein